MAGNKEFNTNIEVKGKINLKDVPNNTPTGFLVWNSGTKDIAQRTSAQLISDLGLITATNIASSYYTKAQLQTSGQSQVHWNNLTNIPTTFTPATHTHSNYVTLDTYQSITALKDLQKGTYVKRYIGNGGTSIRRDVAAYRYWGAVTGALIIEINSTAKADGYLKIKLFNHYMNRVSYLDLGLYSSDPNAVYTNNYNIPDLVNSVSWGLNASGKLCLIINDISTVWNYPEVFVDEFIISNLAAQEGDINMYMETDLSTYTSITSIALSYGSGNVTAGSGLTENSASTNRILTLGTPSTLGVGVSNLVSPISHSHAITTTTTGAANTIVQTNASGIITASGGNSTNWNTAFGWGNHTSAGYLTSALASTTYEPKFVKNTGFNKNFGTAAGTVAQGNDSRILNGQTAFDWGNHAGLYVPKTNIALTQEDLILDLSFNEGAGDICYSAVGNNFITLSNGASFTTGVSGTGVNFLSNSKGVLNSPISDTNLTISVWHRYNDLQGSESWRSIIGTQANYFPIMLGTKRTIMHYGPTIKNTGVLIPDDNKYHHLAYTFSSTNQLKIYLDGILIHSGNHTFDFINYPITGIGASNGYAYGSGDNDEIKIFKKVLSDNEIYDLFKNSFFGHDKIHANQIIGLPTALPPTTHTHTIGEVTGLQGALDGKQPIGNYMLTSHAANGITTTNINSWNTAFGWGNHASAGYITNTVSNLTNYIPNSQKGVANGVASLDANGQVPAIQLPSYVDDVIEAASLVALNALPTVDKMTGKIYVTLDNNKTYRWSGSAFVYITSGAVDSVAGKTGVVTLVKGDVGLNLVDNTTDASKNVLSATKLTTARNINGVPFDGTTNITIVDSTKEPSFTKNTAFNKNFGTAAGTVAQGNDSRINNGQTAFGWGNHAGLYSPINHSHTFASITGKPTTIAGYGITDAYVKTEVDTNIKTAVDNIQIGGRNYFKKDTPIHPNGGITLERNPAHFPEGIHAVGTSNYTAQFRIADVIKSNGWWTVSWDMRGSQNGAYGLEVDICDTSIKHFSVNPDNSWKRYSLSVNVQNYGDGSVYNFVDFSGLDWAVFYIKNIKIEKGNKATDWSPAPEDQISDWNTTDVNDFSFIKNKPIDDIAKGVQAFGWGNHAGLYSLIGHNHTFASITGKPIILEGASITSGFHAVENQFGFINGATTNLGGITSWVGNWINIGSATNNQHKSQLLVSKTDFKFRTMYGGEDAAFNTVWHSGNFNPAGKANAAENAIGIGLSSGQNPNVDNGEYPYFYSTYGYIALATRKWVGDNFDKYNYWNLQTNNVQRTSMPSGSNLNLVAGANVTISYSAGGTVTINAANSGVPANMVTTDSNQTISGIKTFTNTLVISSGNSIYLKGAPDPAHGIRNFSDDSDGFFISSGFSIKLYNNLSSNLFHVNSSGAGTFSGNVTAPAFYEGSLKSLKKNIKTFEKSGLELVGDLNIVTFDRKDKSAKNKIGIIADDSPKEFLSEELDAVDLYKTVFIQAKAIQELTEEVNNLRELLMTMVNNK